MAQKVNKLVNIPCANRLLDSCYICLDMLRFLIRHHNGMDMCPHSIFFTFAHQVNFFKIQLDAPSRRCFARVLVFALIILSVGATGVANFLKIHCLAKIILTPPASVAPAISHCQGREERSP